MSVRRCSVTKTRDVRAAALRYGSMVSVGPEVMANFVDVAIIGAGPYGLSLAAHLGARGIDHRLFGEPMELWQKNMPAGMRLKSDGKSSDLSDPNGELTLARFCQSRDLPFHRALRPVPIETFTAYGLAFQQRFAPHVERKRLIQLEWNGARFGLQFEDGESVAAHRVVIAIGVAPFAHVPEMYRRLPPELASHSSAFGPLDGLDGREVIIVGAGSSALDLAALLHGRGVRVTLVARGQSLVFHDPPMEHRGLLRSIRTPDSKIGVGWQNRICDDAPGLIHALPDPLRLYLFHRLLGPSGGYFLRDQILGRVDARLARAVTSAEARGGRVALDTVASDGRRETLEGDHLILATGLKIDVAKLPFLAPDLVRRVRTIESAPKLSTNYESSVPGLHFIGYASAPSFGPVMRFVCGAPHPARRLTDCFAARTRPSVGRAQPSAAALADHARAVH